MANPTDLERWYIAISLILGFGVILVPTALGHFGKNTSRGGKNSFWLVISSHRFKLESVADIPSWFKQGMPILHQGSLYVG